MFPDSQIAEKMELGPNKLKYLVNHGLAPYFKECLSDILKSEYFVVSFDESLNATDQECEMDLLVRYSWVILGQNCALVLFLFFFFKNFFYQKQCKCAMNIGVAQIRGAPL